jgi:hypothetical protein
LLSLLLLIVTRKIQKFAFVCCVWIFSVVFQRSLKVLRFRKNQISNPFENCFAVSVEEIKAFCIEVWCLSERGKEKK